MIELSGAVGIILALLFSVWAFFRLIPWLCAADVAKDREDEFIKTQYNLDDRVKVVNHSHFYNGATGTVRSWDRREFRYIVRLDRPHDTAAHFSAEELRPYVDGAT